MEKEVLGLTWGCERFKDFLIGRHFLLETDHKPPISLIGHQALTELPLRIQRFRVKLMRYSYSIYQTPVKTYWQQIHFHVFQLLKMLTWKSQKKSNGYTNICVEAILNSMPACSWNSKNNSKRAFVQKSCHSVSKFGQTAASSQDQWKFTGQKEQYLCMIECYSESPDLLFLQQCAMQS